MSEGVKRCKKCGEEKSVAEFSPHSTNRDRLFGRCKKCESEVRNAAQKADRKINPLKYKNYDLQKSFDMTLEEYQQRWEEQNGLCKICGRPETHVRLGKLTMLRVDHSHKTGKTRDLLCNSCNAAIGYMQDDTNRLQVAIEYLKSHEGKE